jgi:hypothetical protein
MAKTKVSEWDSSAAGNTDINGININEGCPPSTINNAIRETMAQVKDLVDGSSGDSLTNSGTLTSSGTLAVTGNFTVDGNSGTSGQYLTSAGSGVTPTWTTPTAFVSGMIMLWSGSSGTIPAGWLLCNGSSGTPDLRNRFVVGATSTYAVGATGGTKDAIVVSHTHTATVTDPGHLHTVTYGDSSASDGFASESTNISSGTYSTNSAVTGVTVANSTEGSSGTNQNLPPYYALCYIMKS